MSDNTLECSPHALDDGPSISCVENRAGHIMLDNLSKEWMDQHPIWLMLVVINIFVLLFYN